MFHSILCLTPTRSTTFCVVEGVESKCSFTDYGSNWIETICFWLVPVVYSNVGELNTLASLAKRTNSSVTCILNFIGAWFILQFRIQICSSSSTRCVWRSTILLLNGSMHSWLIWPSGLRMTLAEKKMRRFEFIANDVWTTNDKSARGLSSIIHAWYANALFVILCCFVWRTASHRSISETDFVACSDWHFAKHSGLLCSTGEILTVLHVCWTPTAANQHSMCSALL